MHGKTVHRPRNPRRSPSRSARAGIQTPVSLPPLNLDEYEKGEPPSASRPAILQLSHPILGLLIMGLIMGSAAPPVFALDLKAPPLAPLAEDGIHDPKGAAIGALQEPYEAMKDFPKDRRGEVDWVRTLQEGYIKPRKSLTGDPWEEAMPMEMDFDIIMKHTMGMPWVRFPHKPHTQWLACSNCHPKIFIPREGANDISMTKVLRGEYCGRCHDKVAFSLFVCERCHSVPHENSPPAWWK